MVGERKQTVDVEFIETPHYITIFWRDLAIPRQRGGRLADTALQSGTAHPQTLASRKVSSTSSKPARKS